MEHWRYLQQAKDDLAARAPEERLELLVATYTAQVASLSSEDVRELFVYAWPDGRDNFDDRSLELRTMLHWIGPVRDVETHLVGTLTIYRAAADHHGVRWTLDEAEATAAAQDGRNLFRATIAAHDLLGHFTGDGRNEALVDPAQLLSVERA